MASQSDDFKWFVNNHEDLYHKYPGKHIVIQNSIVVGMGDSFEEALADALSKGLEIGSFIIQECSEGEESYTQSFSSRVVFA